VFSTAESNPSPPGWQANNDIKFLNVSANGWVSQPRLSVNESSGGVYGWWGTNFSWSPNGEELAYTRPDSIGLVDFDAKTIGSLYDLIPLQTRSDWAWIPEIAWSPDGAYIYLTDHVEQEGLASAEESALFDLVVLPTGGGASPIPVASEVGMFAGPAPSPQYVFPSGESGYKVAFLKAINPTQSRTSGYQMAIIDRDGSNQQILFPPDGVSGMNPQKIIWSPLVEKEVLYFPKIAFIYQSDLWMYDLIKKEAQQITGDGLTVAIDWK
ncbi:MAG: hypothetical protein N2D54_07125, partial [Chloroflexota bacterium]